MGGVPSSWLARLGAAPPFRLGLGFAAAIGVTRAAAMTGAARGAAGLAELGGLAAGAVWLLLWVVVVWHRPDDDALADGALLALALGGGGVLASALFAGVTTGSVGEGVLTAAFGHLGAIVWLVVLAPVCAGVVWVARRAAARAARAFGRANATRGV